MSINGSLKFLQQEQNGEWWFSHVDKQGLIQPFLKGGSQPSRKRGLPTICPNSNTLIVKKKRGFQLPTPGILPLDLPLTSYLSWSLANKSKLPIKVMLKPDFNIQLKN